MSRTILKAFSRPSEIVCASRDNPATRRGREVLPNGQSVGDQLFAEVSEAKLGEVRVLNNHHCLRSRDYIADVKAACPEISEKVCHNSKRISVFDGCDQSWSKVLGRRLADIRRPRRASKKAL